MKNAVIAACLLLGACSNLHTYVKPGTDSVAAQSDIEACKSAMAPYASGDDAKEAFDKCMAGKGYEKKVEKYRF
ncbi:MAG: hypothetical protein OHM77_04530 [Candidatus Nitricoxidivorans perseverans]|uniref:Entry exclusion lipoprotein TrbK n=1 Tax=Candidatus Nitricoxidivorans perseverans TaxID=2975601 RepID=A0AA49IZ44_9PROT|nr:MAG: hypothetical protein OHM77_04530 [Candidatus Nitricoxidivorans perseverans]